jgi:hypothetical protein
MLFMCFQQHSTIIQNRLFIYPWHQNGYRKRMKLDSSDFTGLGFIEGRDILIQIQGDLHQAHNLKWKGKGLPQQAGVAQRVQGRLRPRIFLTFGTTRVVGRQPYASAAFTPKEIPGSHFLETESTPGHMVPSVATEKNPQWYHRESIPRPSD